MSIQFSNVSEIGGKLSCVHAQNVTLMKLGAVIKPSIQIIIITMVIVNKLLMGKFLQF